MKKLITLIVLLSTTTVHAQAQTQATKGKPFNPDISANFLGLAQMGTNVSNDRTVVPHSGLSLQEAEIQFLSDVDPYFRAQALLSVAQEDGTSKFGIDPEEVFLETLQLPSMTLKAGKFKAALGKHNQLHTHAFPFIDAPLIHQALLGGEGLNEAGVSGSFLLPTSWYSEIVVQALGSGNENLYAAKSSGDISGVVHFKNLFDLNDDLTMELGFSGAGGKNAFDKRSMVGAGDLTFKWRPANGGKYHAWIWSTEYLDGKRVNFTDPVTKKDAALLGGGATWIQYQFAERWWVQGRFEYLGLPHSDAYDKTTKQSALIGFFPSEFSGIRVQFDHLNAASTDDYAGALQYNITIGAHPAHAY